MVKQVTNEYQPDYAVSPGEVLSYELELRDMKQQELAKRTGLTPKHIVSLMKADKTYSSPSQEKPRYAATSLFVTCPRIFGYEI